MIITATAWDILTLKCIEEELLADPDISAEDAARAMDIELFRLLQPTPEERCFPN